MTDRDPIQRLRHLGATAALRPALATLAAGQRPGRIVELHRSEVAIDEGDGRRRMRLHPTLARSLADASDGPVVGDWAAIGDDDHGGEWIIHLLPRHSLLERGRMEAKRQRLVANVDLALLVMGLDGDYNPNRLDRYLLLVRSASVAPVVLLTKADRCDDPAARRAEIAATAGAGTPVLLIDPRDPAQAAALAPRLADATAVLLGSSGVGKSTLMNSLLGTAEQRTGATRASDDRGRHTTTARSLHPLPGGGCLIDTPGVRELRPTGDEGDAVDAFEDIHALAGHCRFNDCRHEHEPGCAVAGHVDAERLANFRGLHGEVAGAQRAQREGTASGHDAATRIPGRRPVRKR